MRREINHGQLRHALFPSIYSSTNFTFFSQQIKTRDSIELKITLENRQTDYTGHNKIKRNIIAS